MSLHKHLILLACIFTAGVNVSFGIVVQFNTVNGGLTGTQIREVRDGKLAGFRYQNSFLGTRNYEEGFITNIATGVSSTYKYTDSVKGLATSTQIYAISTTDNNRYGGMSYFGEFLPVRVYGFVKNSNGSSLIVEPSGVSNSSIEGIYGNTCVGWYEQGGKRYGFYKIELGSDAGFYSVLYNKNAVDASSTELRGLWGGTAVGTATYGSISYGFGFNNSGFSNLYSAPGSTSTYFNDYNDGLIAGTATIGGVNTPFLFDPANSQWEFYTSPEGYAASGSSYDNGILAGSYVTATGETLGYYANVPEPKSLFLALFAASLSLLYPRRRKT